MLNHIKCFILAQALVAITLLVGLSMKSFLLWEWSVNSPANWDWVERMIALVIWCVWVALGASVAHSYNKGEPDG